MFAGLSYTTFVKKLVSVRMLSKSLKQKFQQQSKMQQLSNARHFVFLLCLLPSCTKQQLSQQKKNSASDTTQQYHLDDVVLKEAMLVDIPIPLYDERIMLPSSE